MTAPKPRTLPGRAPSGRTPASDLARRLAALPEAERASAIEEALREARSSAPERLSEAEISAAAHIVAALEDGGELALVQPMGPCPGLPWQVEVSGDLVVDAGGFAATIADDGVQGLLARGALAPGSDGRLGTGPRFAEVVPARTTSPRPR
jgi:hypothetical protein